MSGKRQDKHLELTKRERECAVAIQAGVTDLKWLKHLGFDPGIVERTREKLRIIEQEKKQ
jgi:hypothetical protein